MNINGGNLDFGGNESDQFFRDKQKQQSWKKKRAVKFYLKLEYSWTIMLIGEIT